MEHDPIEVVLDVLERHDNRILTADIAALTDSERVVRVIWEVDAQVKNGGSSNTLQTRLARMSHTSSMRSPRLVTPRW